MIGEGEIHSMAYDELSEVVYLNLKNIFNDKYANQVNFLTRKYIDEKILSAEDLSKIYADNLNRIKNEEEEP